jgi:hypothetical protein
MGGAIRSKTGMDRKHIAAMVIGTITALTCPTRALRGLAEARAPAYP